MSFGTHQGVPKHPGTCGGGPGGSGGSAARPQRVVCPDRPDSGRSRVLGLISQAAAATSRLQCADNVPVRSTEPISNPKHSIEIRLTLALALTLDHKGGSERLKSGLPSLPGEGRHAPVARLSLTRRFGFDILIQQ